MTATAEFTRESAEVFLEAFRRGLRPRQRVTVSEWADRHRMLSSRSSKETGRWRTRRFPFLREIMDCLSADSPVQVVVMVKGSQVGGTEVGNNWLGYVVHHAPGPMMAVLPGGDTNKRKSRQTLDPLFEDTPVLRERVSKRHSRDPGNTTLLKTFPGGILVLASAGSAPSLRSMPVKYLFMDELDGWPHSLEGEGDPEELAERGTRNFYSSRKVYKVSTPTVEGRSRITFAFRQTDRRYYHVPCPHCGELQRIRWPNIRWEMGDDEDRLDVASMLKEGQREAWLECEKCHARIDEGQKTKMLEGGVWIPEDPRRGQLVRGYHLSALYSPLGFYPWRASVARHLEAQGNPERLRVWVNQDLGETWKESGSAPEWRTLYERREQYPTGTLPLRSHVLTAGVDVQADRIECELVAWGPDFESWSVDYLVFPGDVEHEDAPWRELDRLLASEWPHADGGTPVRISSLAIDCGFAAQTCYGWLRKFGRSRRVHGIRGRVGTAVLVGLPTYVEVNVGGVRIPRGVRVWNVDTGLAKEQLYGWLHGRPPIVAGQRWPIGYCHFPGYGPEYFKGLASEELLRRRMKNGKVVHDWAKLPNVRNEPLDCRTYARAAAYLLGMDRWGTDTWKGARAGLAARLTRSSAPTDQPAAPQPENLKPQRLQRKERTSRWRRARGRTQT